MFSGTLLSMTVGFVLLVAASYIGTTMALRGFFGREYRSEEPSLSAPSRGDEGESSD